MLEREEGSAVAALEKGLRFLAERATRHAPVVRLVVRASATRPMQGMSAAAVSARLLDDWVVRAGASGALVPRRYFRAQARFLREVWTLATGADFRLPKTTGPRPRFAHLADGYLDLLVVAAEEDPVVRAAMRDVVHLLDSPTALFRPSVVARVLGHRFRQRSEAGSAAEAAAPALPAS